MSTSRGVHRLPAGAGHLLAGRLGARRDALLELVVRDARQADQAGYAAGGARQHLPVNRDRPVAVCGQGGVVLHSHLVEHRSDRIGAVE